MTTARRIPCAACGRPVGTTRAKPANDPTVAQWAQLKADALALDIKTLAAMSDQDEYDTVQDVIDALVQWFDDLSDDFGRAKPPRRQRLETVLRRLRAVLA